MAPGCKGHKWGHKWGHSRMSSGCKGHKWGHKGMTAGVQGTQVGAQIGTQVGAQLGAQQDVIWVQGDTNGDTTKQYSGCKGPNWGTESGNTWGARDSWGVQQVAQQDAIWGARGHKWGHSRMIPGMQGGATGDTMGDTTGCHLGGKGTQMGAQIGTQWVTPQDDTRGARNKSETSGTTSDTSRGGTAGCHQGRRGHKVTQPEVRGDTGGDAIWVRGGRRNWCNQQQEGTQPVTEQGTAGDTTG